MAWRGLNARVDALEGKDAGFVGPAAWIVMQYGEGQDQAQIRFEHENGPVAERMTIFWRPVCPTVECAR